MLSTRRLQHASFFLFFGLILTAGTRSGRASEAPAENAEPGQCRIEMTIFTTDNETFGAWFGESKRGEGNGRSLILPPSLLPTLIKGGEARILSRPKVICLEGQEAVVQVGNLDIPDGITLEKAEKAALPTNSNVHLARSIRTAVIPTLHDGEIELRGTFELRLGKNADAKILATKFSFHSRIGLHQMLLIGDSCVVDGQNVLIALTPTAITPAAGTVKRIERQSSQYGLDIITTPTPQLRRSAVRVAAHAEPAGDALQRLDGPAEHSPIELFPGEQRTLKLREPIQSVDGADAAVLEVKSTAPNELRLTGRASGAARVVIAQADGTSRILNVRVKVDTRELSQLLQQLFPDCKLEAMGIQDAVLLRGTATESSQLKQITEIAELYFPRVINHVTIAKQAPPAAALGGAGSSPQQANVRIFRRDPNAPVLQARVSGPDVSVRDEVWLPVPSLPEGLKRGERVHLSVNYGGGAMNAGEKTRRMFRMIPNAEVLDFRSMPLSAEIRLQLTPEQTRVALLASRATRLEVERAQPDGEAGDLPPERMKLLIRDLESMADRKSQQPVSPYHPGEETSGARRRAEAELLRDIQGLHVDVKRLIALLEKRTSQSTPASPSDSHSSVLPSIPGVPQKGRAVVWVNARWSGPCQSMRPVVEKLIEEGQPIVAIDVDKHQKLAQSYNVSAVPAWLQFWNGRVLKSETGPLSEEKLRDLLKLRVREQ